jgi:fatty acid desaturase
VSKRSRAVAKGLKQKQMDDAELKGTVIVGVVAWLVLVWAFGHIGFWVGLVVFLLMLIGGIRDWMRE